MIWVLVYCFNFTVYISQCSQIEFDNLMECQNSANALQSFKKANFINDSKMICIGKTKIVK